MVKIDNWRVISTGWKSKDRLHLHSATEVHWIGLKHTWAEKRRFHAVLSVLSTIPNISSLSLYFADINEAQQATIFGLSTLRTLMVHSCRFHPSTKPLPSSHVTALKLANTDMQTSRRLLTILASTVETLEVYYFDGTIGSILQDGLIVFPKLSAISMRTLQYGIGLAISHTFKRYTSITTICILFYFDLSELSLDDSDLPALRSLKCRNDLAMRLIPKRPVKTFVEVRSSHDTGPWMLLNALSKTNARITNLKISVSDHFSSLLPSLATSLLHLEQLTLKCFSGGVPWLGASSPDHLSWQPPNSPPGAEAVILPKLKWVTIWVDLDQFKHTNRCFEWSRTKCFIPVCPALEVFECLCSSYYGLRFDFGQPSEPDRAWKTRRLPDGTWERQVPPPIPTLLPAKKLHAAP